MAADQFDDRNPFFAGINEIRSSWGWFLVLGSSLILFGTVCVIANNPATLATILIFGWLMLLGGVFAFVQALRVHTWSGFFIYMLSALLRGFTGFLLIQYPSMGAIGLTLILASFFVVGGLFRAIGAFMLKFPRWGWATFSGILSFVLGILLLVHLPLSSLWFIGFAVGLDMIFDGVALLALALTIHSLPEVREYRTKPA